MCERKYEPNENGNKNDFQSPCISIQGAEPFVIPVQKQFLNCQGRLQNHYARGAGGALFDSLYHSSPLRLLFQNFVRAFRTPSALLELRHSTMKTEFKKHIEIESIIFV